jgi:hypothetical protein
VARAATARDSEQLVLERKARKMLEPAIGDEALLLELDALGARASGRAPAVVVATAVLGLLGFGLWGLPSVDAARLDPFLPHGAEACSPRS